MRAGLRIVEAHPVEQHQRLAEACAADGEIGLHAAGRAFLEVERRVQLEKVHQGVDRQGLAADRKHADRAVQLLQRHRLEGSGDHHGFALLGRLLGAGEYWGKCEYNEKSEGQTVLYLGLWAMMVFDHELERCRGRSTQPSTGANAVSRA